MKKVLLATTMLVAGASIAAAEVTISGDARMGIVNNFVMAPGAIDRTTFTSRARVTFTLSGESDSGLSFGGSFRADNAAGAAAGTAGSVFVSGAFGKLSMGDVDGAAAAAMGHVGGVGLTGLGDLNESLFIANGGLGLDAASNILFGAPNAGPAGGTEGPLTQDPSALYEYSAGALSVYVSSTLPGYRGTITTVTGSTTTSYDGEAYALGVAYTIDNYKVSLGYEKLSVSFIPAPPFNIDASHIILGAGATFGAFSAELRYGQADIDFNGAAARDFEQFALSGTYTMDGLAVTGFYSTQHSTTPAGANIYYREAYGIGASYDLGGGASVVGGLVQQKDQTAGNAQAVRKDNAFDIGLTFTF